jgi:HEAT repeats
MKKRPMTAGEWLKQREQDPRYRERLRTLEEQKVFASEEFKEAAAPLTTELASAGYEISSLSDLAQSNQYKGAIPILIKWLPKVTNVRVKETIVRDLSVPWAKGLAEAALLAEFGAASDSENLGLKWAISNALEVLATDKIFDDLVELIRGKRHGTARQMLVMALGKMKNPKAVNILLGLLDDEEVVGHAVIALRKLNAVEARPYLLPLLKHPKVWVRREAAKALRKIDDLA